MKKVILIMLVLISVYSLQAQQGIQYKVTYQDFSFNMDSTTATAFKTIYIYFDEDYKNTFFTGGNYALWLYWDSTAAMIAGTDSANLGDTDSLFISVKPLIKTSSELIVGMNDSTLVTPNFLSTGFDFDIDKWYLFEFSLPPCSGMQFKQKRNCDVGAFSTRYIVIK